MSFYFTSTVQYNNSNMTISNSISIPRGLKSFMLKNCKVDFLGNSEVAVFYTPLKLNTITWLIPGHVKQFA